MKLHKIIHLLLFELIFVGSAKEEDKDDVTDNPLPVPFYVESFKEFSFSFLFWSIQLCVCIVLILAPIPKIQLIQRFTSVGLGSLLATNHILGFFAFPENVTWFLSYGVAIIAGFLSYNSFFKSLTVSAASSYLVVYLMMIFTEPVNIMYFLLYTLAVFSVFYVASFIFSGIVFSIYKALVCTLSLSIIVNLCTFVNIIDSIHASDWNVVAGLQLMIGKIIVSASFVVFLALIILSNLYRSQIEAVFDSFCSFIGINKDRTK